MMRFAVRNTTRVELIYDADCPNVAAARSVLIKAFTKTGVSACWREWERSASDAPQYAKDYASPTILIDGRDVGGADPQALKGALEATTDFPAITGSITFTPEAHVPQKGVTIIQIKDQVLSLAANAAPTYVPAP